MCILTFQFKKLVATTCDVTPEEVALIFAGKILKDNETLDVHNVQDGYTIHMVLRARTNTSNPTTTTPTVTSQSSSKSFLIIHIILFFYNSNLFNHIVNYILP